MKYLVVVITLFWLSCNSGSKNTEPRSLIGEYHQLFDSPGIRGYPGIIIGIQAEGQPQLIGASGLSNIEEGKAMTINDLFHLASVTKLFTAIGVLKLIDEGSLSLHDAITEYIDPSILDSIPYSQEMTIAHLLDHSSGIYSFNNDLEYIETLLGPKVSKNKVWTNEELLALTYKGKNNPLGKPGSGHYYSDANYILLSMIIERVSHLSFRVYIKQSILEPLKLNNTGFFTQEKSTDPAEKNMTVSGYLKRSEILNEFIEIHSSFQEASQGILNTSFAMERIDASAGIVSSASDLLKFGKAIYLDGFISAKNLAWLLSIGDGIENSDEKTVKQGIVTVRNKPYGVIFTSLGDGAGGVNSMLAYHPKSKSIIMAFTNIFGHFEEHDFFIDEIIAALVADQ